MPIDWGSTLKKSVSPPVNTSTKKTSGPIDWGSLRSDSVTTGRRASAPSISGVGVVVKKNPKVSASDILREVPNATGKVGKSIFNFFTKNTQELIKTAVQNMGSAAAYHLVPEVKKAVDEGRYVLPPMQESLGSGIKKIAGQAVGSAAELAMFAKGAQVVSGGAKSAKSVLQLAKSGAKSGAKYGSAYGLSSGLKENRDASGVAKSTAQGGVLGAITGAVVSPILGKLTQKIGGAKVPKPTEAQQTNIVDDLKLNKDLVKSRLGDVATKIERRMGAGTEAAGVTKTELGKKISSIKTDDIDSVGQLYTKIEKIVKQDKNYKPEMLSDIRGSVQDIFLLQKNDVDVYSKVSESTNPVDELVKAIRGTARVARNKQEQIYAEEKSIRLAQYLKGLKGVKTQQDAQKALGALKGEYTRADFEALKIAQESKDKLYSIIAESDKLPGFQKATATSGLDKIFGLRGGKVPTPTELNALEKLYGKQVTSELLTKQSTLSKLYQGTMGVLNIPRTLMSSMDVSGSFRQGLALAPSHPVEFGRAFGKQFKYLFSEKAFQKRQAELSRSPRFQLAKESGLAVTDIDSHVLGEHEERFASNLADKIPGIGKLVRGSERAYIGMLNDFRMGTFESLLSKAEAGGIELSKRPLLPKQLAQFINSYTGRGGLMNLEKAAVPLNTFFFSPRLISSRVGVLLTPLRYINSDPFVRKEAMKSFISLGAFAYGALGLAKLGGAEVGADPRSADFGKIKVGNTRVDVLGGLQQYIRLAAQLASGEVVSSTTGKVMTLGDGYKSLTRADILQRFVENKEAPIPSLVTAIIRGQNSMGEPTNLPKEVVNRLYPMVIQDTVDAMKELGPKGLLVGGLGSLGFGTQTYGGPKTETYEYVKKYAPDDSGEKKASDVLFESNYRPAVPTNELQRGEKFYQLKGEEKKQFQLSIGRVTVDAILSAPRTPGWSKMTQEEKNKKVKNLISQARERERKKWTDKYIPK